MDSWKLNSGILELGIGGGGGGGGGGGNNNNRHFIVGLES